MPVPDRLVLNSKPQYIYAKMSWEDPLYRKIVDALPANSKGKIPQRVAMIFGISTSLSMRASPTRRCVR